MMRWLAVVVLLAPVMASAQGMQFPWRSPVVLQLPFDTAGCYASGSAMGTKRQTVSITRATSATYEDCAGVVQSCASGQMRVGCSGGVVAGLLVERASTQYVVNPSTHPKTSEATNALSTGAHVAWHRGTGTMTVVAGTATVTGLTCSAVSAGTVCSFTVTVGGTVLVTTTAGTTHAQVETGASRTSDILAAGTRNADVVTVSTPAAVVGKPFCYGMQAQAYKRRPLGATNILASVGVLNSANSSFLQQTSAGQIGFTVYDSGAASKAVTGVTLGWGIGTSHAIAGCSSLSSTTAWNDGTSVGTQSGAGSGVPSSWFATIALGSGNALNQWDGFIKDFRVCSGANYTACRRGSAWPNQYWLDYYRVAALGDSISSLGSPSWPTTVVNTLGSPWSVTGYATSGWTSAQVLSNWNASAKDTRPRTITLLAGVNDIIGGTAGAGGTSTIANLKSIYDEAKAQGARVIAIPILPCGSLASWDASKESVRQAINSWIIAYPGITVVRADTALDDGSGNLNAIYDSGDHLHPNQAGYNLIGSIVAAAFPLP